MPYRCTAVQPPCASYTLNSHSKKVNVLCVLGSEVALLSLHSQCYSQIYPAPIQPTSAEPDKWVGGNQRAFEQERSLLVSRHDNWRQRSGITNPAQNVAKMHSSTTISADHVPILNFSANAEIASAENPGVKKSKS